MQTSKKNTLALCILLKNSADQGSIYINSKDLIKLMNNFYIYSTLPTDPFNFVKEYFPFAHDERSPIIFTASTLFSTHVPLIPEKASLTEGNFNYNFRLSSLKITCIILTLLYCYNKNESGSERLKDILASFTRERRSDSLPKALEFCYKDFKTLLKSRERSDSYSLLSWIDEADKSDFISYFVNLNGNYRSFQQILEAFSKTFGVTYDIFR